MNTKQFQNYLLSRRITIALFLNSSDAKKDPAIQYFTGVSPEHALLAIPARGVPTLFVTGFEQERLAKQSRIPVRSFSKLSHTMCVLTEKAKLVGVNAANMALAERRLIHCRVIDVGEVLKKFRMTKTSQEIEYLTRAARDAGKIFAKTINVWKQFKTELDVAGFIASQAFARGLELSFPSIVACGANAAKPHHEPTRSRLKGFCVIDFGVKYKGYCSDITRTVYVGTPSRAEKAVYETVLRAQEAARQHACPGVACKELDVIARKNLGVHEKFFTHSLGHGIGVEVHEAPALSAKSTDILQPGMTFTVEPGVYDRSFGIRIEDDCVMTAAGVRVLSSISRNLLVLPKPAR